MRKVKMVLHGFYRTKKATEKTPIGSVVLRYLVQGDKEALEAYKEAQGVYYKEHTNPNDPNDQLNGTPLYFSTKHKPATFEMQITPEGKIQPIEDTADILTNMSEDEDFMRKATLQMRAEAAYKRSLAVG